MSGRASPGDLERRLQRLEEATKPVPKDAPDAYDAQIADLCAALMAEKGISPDDARLQGREPLDILLLLLWGVRRPTGPDPVTFVDPDPGPAPERKDSPPDAT